MTRNPVRFVLYCLFLVFLHACGQPQESGSNIESALSKVEQRKLRISSFDGTELASKLFQPKSGSFTGPRPAVIFANSWAFNEEEYDAQARILAEKGYIVLSYSARGFGTSGGMITSGGADDVQDVSTLIDWLQTNTSVDIQNIGMAGVSYGGGMALLALAHEPRLKTAVSLSGWGNLGDAIYGQETIRDIWLKVLLISGKLFGRMDPAIAEHINDLRKNQNVDAAKAWAAERSPLTYVDQINARQAPVFISNSFQDNLFPPNQIRPFYEALTGPKMIYLNPGIHTSSSFGGLVGAPSAVWSEVNRWLDYWLRGVETGIINQAAVSFEVSQVREFFPRFPGLMKKTAEYNLTPLNALTDFTDDSPSLPAALSKPIAAIPTISFGGGLDSGATSGFPLISDTIEAILDHPVTKHVSRIDKRYAAVYKSGQLSRTTRLRGAAEVSVYLESHKTPLQLVAYLYDVDKNGMGTLVAHGVFSRRVGHPEPSMIDLKIATVAYDFAAGHSLVVALDTRDPLYENTNNTNYSLAFKHADPEATAIQMPLIP